MAYPLGQPLDSLFTFFLLYLVSLRAPYSSFSCSFPSLLFYLLFQPYIYFPSVDVVVSLLPSVFLNGHLRDQPLVNLIISATPDKRRRQNVIPTRSHSTSFVSNSKWCRWLTWSYNTFYHIVGLFLALAALRFWFFSCSQFSYIANFSQTFFNRNAYAVRFDENVTCW